MTIGAGDVEIKLVSRTGELITETLRPTFNCSKKVSRMSGGFLAASRRILELDLDAYVAIIGAGLGYTETGMINLDDRVYKTGLTDLAEPLVRFIRILANGGKPPKEQETEDGEVPLEEKA